MRTQASRGFTLIELMVTVAIVTLLMLVAMPSLTTFKRNAELTSATNTLLSAINAARGEAMKRGRYAMVTPTDGSTWNNGLIVFVDMDRSRVYNASTDVLVMTQPALPSYLTLGGSGAVTSTEATPYLMYDPNGFARSYTSGSPNQTFTLTRTDLTGSDLSAQTRRIKISVTGRVRTCKPASSTDLTCSQTGD